MSDRPTFETLLYTHEAKVATITLHRPEAANAFNETMFQELYIAILHALTQADTRVILLNSVGKIFCAGGAGMALVRGADLVLASENARFTMAYTAAGLSPDGSSTFYLPRLVGLRRALELTLTNRRLSAQEALDWGIVNRILPAETLQEKALALARQLAAGPALAYAAAKRLLQRSFDQSLETQLEDEAQAIAAASATADAREGIRAFLEKRPPQFRGE